MELYVGGSFQGKLFYVIDKKKLRPEDIIDGASCTLVDCRQAKALNHLHLFVRRIMEDNFCTFMDRHGKEPGESEAFAFLQSIIDQNQELIFICDEVGLGIVPLEKEERLYREEVGRILCMIAEKSDRVERIVCGLGQVIKG